MTVSEINRLVKLLERRLDSAEVALLRKAIAQAPTKLLKELEAYAKRV